MKKYLLQYNGLSPEGGFTDDQIIQMADDLGVGALFLERAATEGQKVWLGEYTEGIAFKLAEKYSPYIFIYDAK